MNDAPDPTAEVSFMQDTSDQSDISEEIGSRSWYMLVCGDVGGPGELSSIIPPLSVLVAGLHVIVPRPAQLADAPLCIPWIPSCRTSRSRCAC